MFNPEFLTTESDAISGNDLIKYLQEQSPDVLQRVARSSSPDIQEIIRHNVQGLLGLLPGEQFEVKIQTSRDNLAGLLASAMMTGYFLRQMEQRMELESSMFGPDSDEIALSRSQWAPRNGRAPAAEPVARRSGASTASSKADAAGRQDLPGSGRPAAGRHG